MRPSTRAASTILVVLLTAASGAATTAAVQTTPSARATASASASAKAAAAKKAAAKKARLAAARKRALAQQAAGRFVTVDSPDRVPLPALSASTFDGHPWSSSTLRGRVSVVNLWASWCSPCREEWPELQAAAAAHPMVRFVGVDSMDAESAARAFLDANPSAFEQISDARSVLMSSFTTVPNRVLPITVIVDARGRIAAWRSGPVTKALIDAVLATL